MFYWCFTNTIIVAIIFYDIRELVKHKLCAFFNYFFHWLHTLFYSVAWKMQENLPSRSFFPSLNNLDLSLFTTHSTHNYAGIATNNCFFREIKIITPIMHIVVTLAKKSKITDDGDRLVCSAHSGGDGSIIKWTSSFLFEIKNTKKPLCCWNHVMKTMWPVCFMKWKHKNCLRLRSLTNFLPFSCVEQKVRKLLHQFAEVIFGWSAIEVEWACIMNIIDVLRLTYIGMCKHFLA